MNKNTLNSMLMIIVLLVGSSLFIVNASIYLILISIRIKKLKTNSYAIPNTHSTYCLANIKTPNAFFSQSKKNPSLLSTNQKS